MRYGLDIGDGRGGSTICRSDQNTRESRKRWKSNAADWRRDHALPGRWRHDDLGPDPAISDAQLIKMGNKHRGVRCSQVCTPAV
jgi:hypothetical protein